MYWTALPDKCKSFCKESSFFTWNSRKNECYCKNSDAKKRNQANMVSGKTDCITGESGYILDYEQYIELSPFYRRQLWRKQGISWTWRRSSSWNTQVLLKVKQEMHAERSHWQSRDWIHYTLESSQIYPQESWQKISWKSCQNVIFKNSIDQILKHNFFSNLGSVSFFRKDF